MSHLLLIITKNKIDLLPKERYLKFYEYGYFKGFFIYLRYDYSLGMIDLLNEENYSISSVGKQFLEKILSAHEIYWSVIQLGNHEGDDTSLKYLKLIENQKFKKATLHNEKFSINTLYYLE